MNPATIPLRILDWLRAGYPEGVPRRDYVALLAVLHHRLTDAEIRHVVAELTDDRADASAVHDREIEAAIAAVALQEPSEADVARVRARLAAGGWPLADPARV